jgi:predicted nuclease of predicted toxin-antitoxin system
VKVKLDQNLGAMGPVFVKAAGCEVATVADQNLLSTSDADLVRTCAAEQRCLVTLDRDFSNPFDTRLASSPESSSFD